MFSRRRPLSRRNDRAGTAHPEVTLLVTSSLVPAGQLLSYESDVSVLRNGDEVYSAVWMNLVHPVGIKICYLKAGAPVREPPGFPWHPTRQRKLVKSRTSVRDPNLGLQQHATLNGGGASRVQESPTLGIRGRRWHLETRHPWRHRPPQSSCVSILVQAQKHLSHANLSDDNSDSPSHRYATNGPPLATL
jgi:hypothetical protein